MARSFASRLAQCAPAGAGRRTVRHIAARLVIVALALAAVAVAGGLLDRRSSTATATGEATVTRVVDGDTVVLSGAGRSRLIGMDTPEVYGGAECFGGEASAYAKRLLTGRRVRYRVGVEPRDRYGRALVYLWLADGRFVNELLVAGGWARTLEIAPNVRYAARLRLRAREARAARRGLWSPAACG